MRPTLSVILVNYNHAQYLTESISAILDQSWKPKEIIFVDDASTDNSCEIVKSFQNHHPEIKLIRREKNSGGPILPLKDGLEVAIGDYLALCAADDMILPGFFQEAMEFLSAHSELGICCGDLAVFHDGPKPYKFDRQRYLTVSEPKVFAPKELAKICRTTPFQIASQASIYRKEAVLRFGGYKPNLHGYSDFFLNYQIGFSYPIAYLPRLWATFRKSPLSYGQNVNWKARYELVGKFLNEIRNEPKPVQKLWRKSCLLAHAGPAIGSYLISHPIYWMYFPYYFPKWLFKKICGYTRRINYIRSKIRKVRNLFESLH